MVWCAEICVELSRHAMDLWREKLLRLVLIFS